MPPDQIDVSGSLKGQVSVTPEEHPDERTARLRAEQRGAWRAAVAPAWPEMVKAMGGDAESLFKTMDTARAACKR